MKNNLAVLRKQHGMPAAALATTVGVSRQTIYAVENGTYVPNTAVALRLARSLGVSVEQLFELGETQPAPQTVLPLTNGMVAGQSVQLCQVGTQLVAVPATHASWCLPESDAALTSRHQAKLHSPETSFNNRLLLAGCDPTLGILGRHLRPAGIELILTHQNSYQALALLKQDRVHIAGIHLPSNPAAISKLFRKDDVAVVSFAVGEEGLLTAAGNPKLIKSVEHLARKGVRFINRETGSGSRALLDAYLSTLKLDHSRINGYNRTAPGHLAVAWEVKTGTADCCLATRSAARVCGLEFISLESVRYDLAVKRRNLHLPAVQTLFDVISHSHFRQSLKSVGGHDPS